MNKTEPIYHLGISGGKDSQALLVWAVTESGLPLDRIRVTFCNTHNEDELTYNHVRLLDTWARQHGLPGGIEWLEPDFEKWMQDEQIAEIVKEHPEVARDAFFLLAAKKRRFPSRKAQFCTDHLKIQPTKKWVKRMWDDGYTNIVMLSGVRADESAERSKLPEREPAFLSKWGCETWRPLLRWTWNDVVALNEKNNLPLNPLYSMGARRVGCFPCVNCGKVEIKMVARHRPEKIAQIRKWETLVGTVRSHAGYSNFFPSKTVTKPFRRGPYKNKDGEDCWYTTIDLVVEWAKTTRGGRQMEMQFNEDTHTACSARYGQCE